MLPIIPAVECFLQIFASLPRAVHTLASFGFFLFVIVFVIRLLLSL